MVKTENKFNEKVKKINQFVNLKKSFAKVSRENKQKLKNTLKQNDINRENEPNAAQNL